MNATKTNAADSIHRAAARRVNSVVSEYNEGRAVWPPRLRDGRRVLRARTHAGSFEVLLLASGRWTACGIDDVETK